MPTVGVPRRGSRACAVGLPGGYRCAARRIEALLLRAHTRTILPPSFPAAIRRACSVPMLPRVSGCDWPVVEMKKGPSHVRRNQKRSLFHLHRVISVAPVFRSRGRSKSGAVGEGFSSLNQMQRLQHQFLSGLLHQELYVALKKPTGTRLESCRAVDLRSFRHTPSCEETLASLRLFFRRHCIVYTKEPDLKYGLCRRIPNDPRLLLAWHGRVDERSKHTRNRSTPKAL